MQQKQHSWIAKIRTGHRLTVPDWIIEDFETKVGDKLQVTVEPISRSITANNAVIKEGSQGES